MAELEILMLANHAEAANGLLYLVTGNPIPWNGR